MKIHFALLITALTFFPLVAHSKNYTGNNDFGVGMGDLNDTDDVWQPPKTRVGSSDMNDTDD